MAIPEKTHLLENETKNLTPQIKIIIYRWLNNNPPSNTPNSELNKSERLDITSQVMSCSFSKTLSNPAGTFQFSLSNSPGLEGEDDWKNIIKPGSWVVIYMTQDGDLPSTPTVSPPNTLSTIEEASRTVCVGYVDRVSVTSELGDRGQFDLVTQVAGRDFGVIYEDSNIWQNLFQFDKILLEGRGITGLDILGTVKINEALQVIHDLVLYPANLPGANVNDQNSMASIGLQWLLPRELVTDVFHTAKNFGGETFWGNIPNITQFSETEASLAIDRPSDYLFGNVWSNLRAMSVPELHELYCELNEVGEPRLNFRPLPLITDKTGYPLQGRHVTLYKDLDFVEIPASEVFSFDLGESNSERFNSFLVTVNTSMISVENNISILKGTGFPNHDFASVKRNGFRPNHISTHALVKNAEQRDGASHEKLLGEFNHYLQDIWENAVFAESGSASIVGNNKVRVGNCMKFGDTTPYVSGKRYYVEGYVHNFNIGANGERDWTTSVFLAWGFEEKDLLAKDGFSDRSEKFIQNGEFTQI